MIFCASKSLVGITASPGFISVRATALSASSSAKKPSSGRMSKTVSSPTARRLLRSALPIAARGGWLPGRRDESKSSIGDFSRRNVIISRCAKTSAEERNARRHLDEGVGVGHCSLYIFQYEVARPAPTQPHPQSTSSPSPSSSSVSSCVPATLSAIRRRAGGVGGLQHARQEGLVHPRRHVPGIPGNGIALFRLSKKEAGPPPPCEKAADIIEWMNAPGLAGSRCSSSAARSWSSSASGARSPRGRSRRGRPAASPSAGGGRRRASRRR